MNPVEGLSFSCGATGTKTGDDIARSSLVGKFIKGGLKIAILRAALESGEELDFEDLTVEGIAARSGIAKTTIYRRWPNVGAIVMDVFLADVTRLAPIQTRATASMRLLARAYRGRLGKLLRLLLGKAQSDENLREAVRTRWVEPRRQVAREIVCRGVKSGELRAGLDPDVVLDALYGSFYHRLLVPYKNGVISDAFINALVDTVFGGLERHGRGALVQTGNRSAGKPDDIRE